MLPRRFAANRDAVEQDDARFVERERIAFDGR